MKQLVRINLSLLLKPKAMLLTTLVFILLSVFQALTLINYSNDMSTNIGDYFLLSMGGVLIHDNLSRQLAWIGTVIPILFYIYHLVGFAGSYDVFILTRLQSRLRWWKAKFVSMMILVVLYGVWLSFIHFIVGIGFFPIEQNWGTLIENQLSFIFNLQQSASQINFLALLTFLSGTLAFCSLVQCFALLFRNSHVYYVDVMIASVLLFGFYSQGLIARFLSPLNYSSLLDLLQTENQGLRSTNDFILYNMIIFILCFILGLIFIRKSNFLLNHKGPNEGS
ncbi:MAG: hypothetical protein ACYDG2_00370 [Ruminiclostridium sp.]